MVGWVTRDRWPTADRGDREDMTSTTTTGPTPTADRPTDRTYLAVLRDRATADAVVRELADELDDASSGAIASHDAHRAHRASLRAEMSAETRDAGIVPPSGLHVSEEARPASAFAAIGALLGLVLIGPLGFVEAFGGGLVLRLVVTVVLGTALGAWVGLLLGGILGRRAATKPLAAERGVTVLLHASELDDDAIVDRLAAHDPIRVDRVLADGSFRPVVDERDLHPELEAERLGANVVADDRSDVV